MDGPALVRRFCTGCTDCSLEDSLGFSEGHLRNGLLRDQASSFVGAPAWLPTPSGDELRSPKAAGHAEQKVDKWWSNSAVY